MQLEKPKSYLIKRSNSFRDLKKNNSKKKGYFEITIRKDKMDPPSSKLKIKISFMWRKQVVVSMQKGKL